MEDATWSISQEACLPSPATSLPVSPNLLLFPFLLKKKKDKKRLSSKQVILHGV